jgi:hypothetical protein
MHEAFELINRWHHTVRKFDNFKGVVETLMKHIPGWLEIRDRNRIPCLFELDKTKGDRFQFKLVTLILGLDLKDLP